MTNPVDAVFEQEMVREDTVEIILGSGYGDIIDLVNDNVKGSIFDSEKEVTEYDD